MLFIISRSRFPTVEASTDKTLIGFQSSVTLLLVFKNSLELEFWYLGLMSIVDSKHINKYITSQIPDGLGAEVTGTAFLALRTNNYLVNNLLASFFIALLIITFLMIFLFRSIKIALISILPNIIPMMIN